MVKLTRIGLFLSLLCSIWMGQGHVMAQDGSSSSYDSAECLQILIPLYIYPNWYAGAASYQWDDVAAASSQVPIVAIINPASGPTATPNSDYVQGMNDLAAGSNVKMIGYVRTNYADQPIETVKAEIDIYADTWSGWITGIFFDEGATSADDLAYYQEIYDYAHAKPTLDLVVVNPGTTPNESYFSQPAADIGTIFESFSTSWPTHNTPSYVNNYARSRFSMMVHTTPDAATMQQHLDLALSRGFGYVYVTDEDLAGNPWDNLPSFWSAEVNYIEQLNQSCVPTAVQLSTTATSSQLKLIPLLSIILVGLTWFIRANPRNSWLLHCKPNRPIIPKSGSDNTA